MSSRSGSTGGRVVTWSAVVSVHGSWSVGNMWQRDTWTSAWSRQSLLTGQYRATRRLRYVHRCI